MAGWLLFAAFGAIPNLVAVVLLVVGLRTSSLPLLSKLLRRAVACLVLVAAGTGLGVLYGFLIAYGAIGGEAAGDVSQKARRLAEGISEVMNCIAAGMVCLPLPIAAAIVLGVRSSRLARGGQPSTG